MARLRMRIDRSLLRLGVAVAALALAAVNYESNAAWLIATLILGMSVVSALHARRNLRGVTVSVGACEDVFAEDPVAIPVHLRCDRGERFGVEVAIGDGLGRCPRLGDDGEVKVVVEHPPLSRGLHRLDRIQVRTRWPYGLLEVRSDQEAQGSLLVYPKPGGTHLDARAVGGDGLDAGNGRLPGDDFVGHRRYQPGDPRSRIDWRAVARGRPLMVKRFAGGAGSCWLDYAEASGGVEARLSQLARWILDADQLGWRYGLRLPGREIQPATGPQHRLACLRALALQPAGATT